MGRARVGTVAAALAWAGLLVINRSLRVVSGASMEPRLPAGSRVLVLPRRLAPPRVGDVAVVADPRDARNEVIKRIAARGPAVVELREGRLVVDGEEVAEPFALLDGSEDLRPVAAGELYVLGDRRDASTDSRTFGPVAAASARRVVAVRVVGQRDRTRSSGPSRSSSGMPARE